LFLANRKYYPIFAPNVITKMKYEDENYLKVKDKLLILKYGFSNIFNTGFKTWEFLTTFFKPSSLVVILLYIGFFSFLYNFEVKNMFFYDIKYIFTGALITLGIFIISLFIVTKDKISPFLLILSPIYRILEIIFSPNKNRKKMKKKEKSQEPDIKGFGENVQITDGINVLNCSIEIKNTGNGKKVVFRHKNKKTESGEYPSAREAINEINDKLNENGLKLLVCSCCTHFGFKPNTDISKQKGLCSCIERMTGDVQPETKLLNYCEYFQAFSELKNMVEFPKDNNNNNK
ncbi:hypothetical protein IJG14_04540, partial [bacterium]|nr:hypothetical protein [bacterium]